jgi:hypothetical protein
MRGYGNGAQYRTLRSSFHQPASKARFIVWLEVKPMLLALPVNLASEEAESAKSSNKLGNKTTHGQQVAHPTGYDSFFWTRIHPDLHGNFT